MVALCSSAWNMLWGSEFYTGCSGHSVLSVGQALATDHAGYSHCLLMCQHHAQSSNQPINISMFSTTWAQVERKNNRHRFLSSFTFVHWASLPLKVASTNLSIPSPGAGLISMIWDISLISSFHGDKVMPSLNYFLLQCQCQLGRRQADLKVDLLTCIEPFYLQTRLSWCLSLGTTLIKFY